MSANERPLFRNVLLIEDEPALAATLEVALKPFSEQLPKHALNLQDARKIFRAEPIEFVVIDRQLPDGDGVDFCQEIRSKGFKGMILFLTARGAIEDRVQGLKSGADDYLAKPFSLEELKARIEALARRKPEFVPPRAVELWTIDETSLSIDGPIGQVVLTPLEFKMVKHLMDADGAIVSREQLLRDVWGFRFLPQTRTVDYFMGRLRKKFEQDPENPAHFLTVRGAGYKFKK